MNASSNFSILDEATKLYGTPTEQRLVRRDQLPPFEDPLSEGRLRAVSADALLFVSTWRHSCWFRGDESLTIVSVPATGRIVAARSVHTLWR